MGASSHNPLLLARYAALAAALLIIYVSLHPLTGWQSSGVSPFAFLSWHWPRYWITFDIFSNVIAYLPLGFFLRLAFDNWRQRWAAAIFAALLAAALSFSMEFLQNFLPTRVPSHLDFACNSLGGAVGVALAMFFGGSVFSRLAHLQRQLIAPVPHAELGLTILGLWFFVPLSPETFLFGAGDLRWFFDLSEFLPMADTAAGQFILRESAVTAINMLLIGLLLRQLLRSTALLLLVIPLFFQVGLLLRCLSAAILISPQEILAWLTPGAQLGLLTGFCLVLFAIFLPRSLQIFILVLTTLSALLLVNLTPLNPYSLSALATWQQGSFLNFNGLTRLVASLWPFLVFFFVWITWHTHRRFSSNSPFS